MQWFYDIQIRSYELSKSTRREKKLLPRSDDEEYALSRLLWCLNSGGRRSYEIVSRPEKEERNLKCPDFICRDKITGTYITVEITQIIHHEDAIKAQVHKTRVWYEIAKCVEGKLPGAFQLTLPVKLDTRGVTTKQLAKLVMDKSSNMALGDNIQLRLGLQLSKRGNEGSFLTYVEEKEDEHEDDPVQLVTPDQVVRAIEKPLQETNEKFNACAKGLRVLILDSQDIPLDIIDAPDLLGKISLEKYPSIDRIYLLNTSSRGKVIRFS